MLKFDREGLIPAVIQDDTSNEVLMVAFMNQAAFDLTRETGYTHFYSRSRNTLWRKGEQSGNTQEVRSIYVNCEENSLLIRVTQNGGAACHTGYRSCYYRRLLPDGSYETIAQRVFDPDLVYGEAQQFTAPLEKAMRQLYGVYIYLRDHDMSEESNTSRLLQEHSPAYLAGLHIGQFFQLVGQACGEGGGAGFLQEARGVGLLAHIVIAQVEVGAVQLAHGFFERRDQLRRFAVHHVGVKDALRYRLVGSGFTQYNFHENENLKGNFK
jgi:phosphoribosyl-AMP cyclohydrolase